MERISEYKVLNNNVLAGVQGGKKKKGGFFWYYFGDPIVSFGKGFIGY